MSAAFNPRPQTNVCNRSRHGQTAANHPDEIARQTVGYPLGNSLYFALSTFGALSILILLLLCSCGKKPAPLVNTSQSVPAPPQPKPDVSSAIVDDFLAHPVAITAPHWQKVPKPEEVIPGFLRQLADGPEDIDRGMAVGMLAEYAIGLSGEMQAHRVAREIIEKFVLPNLAYTKLLYVTDARSWQYAILNCVTVYKRLGDTEAEKKCIHIFEKEAPLAEDREMGTYMLAYWHAAQKDYSAAISTIQSQPPTSKWADRSGRLTAAWKKIQSQKAKPSPPKLPTP